MRALYFSKFDSHVKKVKLARNLWNEQPSPQLLIQPNQIEPQGFQQTLQSLPDIFPNFQNLPFKNASYVSPNLGFCPIMHPNNNLLFQSNNNVQDQRSDDQAIIRAIQNMKDDLEDKLFNIQKDQTTTKNIVDGLVHDILQLKKQNRAPNRASQNNRGGRGGQRGSRNGRRGR